MKKFLAIMLTLLMTISASTTIFAENSVNIADNGEATVLISSESIADLFNVIQADFVTHEGATYLPLRTFAENFGAGVHWNEATSGIDIQFRGTALAGFLEWWLGFDLSSVIRPGVFTISLQYVGDSIVLTDGAMSGVGFEVINVNGRILIPVIDFDSQVIIAGLPLLISSVNQSLLNASIENITGASNLVISTDSNGLVLQFTIPQ
ncbi:MAG: copper amine oxidase N-terminal domain-containing protein [Defluviitaleaceae bacterium]|nr:copper amine oxidase N-terminal domain-containing protein [Defluviitaleaceae bacterium]